MDENKLIDVWISLRTQLVVSQFAPTFLLITTVGLVPLVRSAGMWAVIATLGILLASGILGALVQFTAADEAQATARDLASLTQRSATSDSIIRRARVLHVAKFVTPTIFVAIFVALAVAVLSN